MRKSTIVLMVLALSVSLLLSFLPVLAQDQSPVYVELGYMKVAPNGIDEYLSVERDLWKPIHQARLQDGIITGWALYEVWYPGGTAADYNYVTVNAYQDFSKMALPPLSDEKIQQIHPGVTMDELMNRTNSARDMVRIEMWSSVDLANQAELRVGDFVQIGYMRVQPGKENQYVRLEQEIWKPIQQQRIAAGQLAHWGIYGLWFPGGTNEPYNFCAVNVYREFADLALGFTDEMFQKALPGADLEVVQEQTIATRDMVQVDTWRLIDRVP